MGKCHKRSLKQIYETLQKDGHDTNKLKHNINDIIIKTLISGSPEIAHVYRSCQPDDYENSMCFQILGFDVMIDDNLKPWLIEVNHAPSFATESMFDQNLKQKLVQDTFVLLNLSNKKKNTYFNNQRIQFQKRILTGKAQKLTQEEKEQKRKEHDEKRNRIESKISGGYKLVYPGDLDIVKLDRYKKFEDTSRELFDYFTLGKKAMSSNLKNIKDHENSKNDGKRQWKHTGNNNIPLYNKPSKYQ